jgi:hypothetical protein
MLQLVIPCDGCIVITISGLSFAKSNFVFSTNNCAVDLPDLLIRARTGFDCDGTHERDENEGMESVYVSLFAQFMTSKTSISFAVKFYAQ